jgi:hypothetical protein
VDRDHVVTSCRSLMLGVVDRFISSISPKGRVPLRRNDLTFEISCENSSFTVCRKPAREVPSFINDPTYEYGFSRESPNPLPVYCSAYSGRPRLRSMLTLLSCVTHNLRAYPKLVSFIANTNRPNSKRSAVPSHSHHKGKLRIPISPCVLDLLSST